VKLWWAVCLFAMTLKSQLSRLEARVEALVEGIFANPLQPPDLTISLTRALEDSAGGGRPPATHYIVRLHPADVDRLLQDHPTLADDLAEALLQAAREAHLTLPRRPDIILLPGEDIKPRGLVVVADVNLAADSSITQSLTPMARPAPPPAQPSTAAAFLIINGTRTIALNQPIMNIGRRLDNHLILEDNRVSRTHAQIRQRFGRYMLYDLGSRGGTCVNGQRVVECVLQPGDVITLGGTQLIYGEGIISQVPLKV
jgi:hypothetical protein